MKSHCVFDGILTGFSLLSFLLIASSGMAAEKAQQSDLAIKGYDAVAYFKIGKAVKGSESFTFPWHDMAFLIQREQGPVRGKSGEIRSAI
jgi:hypothetical protein